MELQQILDGLSYEARRGFLQKAYRPERKEIADALIDSLMNSHRDNGHLIKVLEEQITRARKGAGKFESPEREKELYFKLIQVYVDAHTPGEVKRLTKEAEVGDPKICEKVVAYCQKDYWQRWETAVDLLEFLGRTKEAKEFALEAAKVLDESRKKARAGGGSWVNHGIDRIYRRFGMHREEVEVRLDNGDFGEAIRLAQEHLSKEELPDIYKRVYAAAEGRGYHHGFPEQIKAAELLKDEELLKETKEKYLHWFLSDPDVGGLGGCCPLGLIREVGTLEQLRAEHDRIIRFHTEEGFPTDLARAAEEAYNDLGDQKYAELAMNSYERLKNFPKALEYARAVDEKKAAVLQEAVNLMQS